MLIFLADDDSDNNPHDFEGNNSDLELGNDDMIHFKGHNSFTQMQVRKKRQSYLKLLCWLTCARSLEQNHMKEIYRIFIWDFIEFTKLMKLLRLENIWNVFSQKN